MQRHRPGTQFGPHVQRPGEDLRDEQHEQCGRQKGQRAHARRQGSGTHGDPQHEQQGARREQAVREHERRRPAEGGDEPAVHERPVTERQARAAGADVGADEKECEHRRRRPCDESRESGRRESRGRGRGFRGSESRIHRHEHGDRDERHRRGEVRRDERRVEVVLDDDRSERGLGQNQDACGDASPKEAPGRAESRHREHRDELGREQRDHDRGQPSVGVLDQPFRVRKRRKEVLGGAPRPAGAPEAR